MSFNLQILALSTSKLCAIAKRVFRESNRVDFYEGLLTTSFKINLYQPHVYITYLIGRKINIDGKG
jgi:hypothetical protein